MAKRGLSPVAEGNALRWFSTKHNMAQIAVLGIYRNPQLFIFDRTWIKAQSTPVSIGSYLDCVKMVHNLFNIGKWIIFYNETRPHSTFDEQTPDEVYYDFQYQGHAPDIETVAT